MNTASRLAFDALKGHLVGFQETSSSFNSEFKWDEAPTLLNS